MANTKLEQLNLLDKFLFDEAMEDRETYQAAISILLENEVELLGGTETEKELRVSPELRQVRLDVVGMDREGTIYYAGKSEKAGMKYMQRWEEIAFAREDGKVEGKAEGKAASVLELLGDIEPVPLTLRDEIMAESSEEILGKWLRMAARAGSIEEFIKRKAEEDSLLQKAPMAAGKASDRLPAGENDIPNAAHCFSSSVLS